jgi:hypothetical protein
MKSMAYHVKALGLLLSAVLAAPLLQAQSPAVALERTQYFNQIGVTSSTSTLNADGVSLNFNLRGGATDMSAWAPTFYKPGTSQTPQTGPSSDTNTGTLNFSATPNNGLYDYLFTQEFSSTGALEAFYPNGDYGIIFQNEAALEPSTGKTSFTAGLAFNSSAYPGPTPEITNITPGAKWVPGGGVMLPMSGITTFTFSDYISEYDSATYGAVIGVGIYETATGNVIIEASKEAYNLPLGDSSATPTPHYDTPFNEFSIDSSWLTAGVPYTVEIHFTVFSSRPEEANLTPTGGSAIEFQGVTTARKVTTVSIMVPATNADFNADGQSDLVWRNSQTGQWAFWLMNGTTPAIYEGKSAEPLAWEIAAKGDFNADGQSDLIWTNTQTGEWKFWLMNGTNVASVENRAAMPLAWRIVGSGDFNMDGHSDIIWNNFQTGEWAFWLLNGTTPISYQGKAPLPVEWRVSGVGDFNSDGQSDLVWSNTQTGAWAIWLMNGTTPFSYQGKDALPLEWQITGSGDFNSDGKGDLIWKNTQTGAWAFWLMDGTTPISYQGKAAMPLEWQIVR